jgi:hypothetical protein
MEELLLGLPEGGILNGIEGADAKSPGLPSPFQGQSVEEEHLATPVALPSTVLDHSRWARPTTVKPPAERGSSHSFLMTRGGGLPGGSS